MRNHGQLSKREGEMADAFGFGLFLSVSVFLVFGANLVVALVCFFLPPAIGVLGNYWRKNYLIKLRAKQRIARALRELEKELLNSLD